MHLNMTPVFSTNYPSKVAQRYGYYVLLYKMVDNSCMGNDICGEMVCLCQLFSCTQTQIVVLQTFLSCLTDIQNPEQIPVG